jgi:hypothetical protein
MHRHRRALAAAERAVGPKENAEPTDMGVPAFRVERVRSVRG